MTARALPWLLGSTCGYGNRKLPVVSATSTLVEDEVAPDWCRSSAFPERRGSDHHLLRPDGHQYPFSMTRKAAVLSSRHSAVCPPTIIPHILRTQLLAVYKDLLRPHYLM